jgi:hypothetical protein
MDAHATPAAQMAYNDLAEELAGAGATVSSMFGMPVLKHHKKPFAGLLGDGATFRLTSGIPEHTEALRLTGSALADPSGMGRPMKDWVHVPVTHATTWLGYARVAMSRLG